MSNGEKEIISPLNLINIDIPEYEIEELNERELISLI